MQTDLITKVYFNEHLTHSCVGMPQGLQALLSSSTPFSLYEFSNWKPSYNSTLLGILLNLTLLFWICFEFVVIRHSRLPAGNALWVCQNFFFFFLFFRRQGFRMITFDRQVGPLQNFNRSHIMVIGRSVLFSDPARPPGGGVGRPKHPKIPPPPPEK